MAQPPAACSLCLWKRLYGSAAASSSFFLGDEGSCSSSCACTSTRQRPQRRPPALSRRNISTPADSSTKATEVKKQTEKPWGEGGGVQRG